MAIKKWEDDKVSIGDLNLDLQNPRIPKHVKEQGDINLVRNHLLEKEGVLKIARSIVNNGYHRSAVAIVTREKGKLIVLDGNRRLAACEFLLNPTLVPNARDKKEFEELNKRLNKNSLKEIKIVIAPSRREAEKEIWDIHVNELSKPWEVLQKLRMYRNLIDDGEYDVRSASSGYGGVSVTEFKDELAKLYFYEQILEQEPRAEEVLLNSGFNKIDRLVLSKNGKKFLGYTVDDKGDVVADKTSLDTKLKKLIPYIIDPQRVNAQAKQDWIKDNVFAVIDPINFHKGIVSPRKKKILSGIKKDKKVAPKCFVVMPLAGLDPVYKVIKSAWGSVFGKTAKVYHQGDDKRKGGTELMDTKILKNIKTATIVVGLLSMGDKERELYNSVPIKERGDVFQKSFPFNTNVAFEVGYALHCAESKTEVLDDIFLIADNTDEHSTFKFMKKYCFDLGHRDITPYKNNELDKLEKALVDYFTHYKKEKNI